MAPQTVTIGRIVRFRDTDGSDWPAIITVVLNDTLVNLQVFRTADVTARASVPLDSSTGSPQTHFTWRWPDRN